MKKFLIDFISGALGIFILTWPVIFFPDEYKGLAETGWIVIVFLIMQIDLLRKKIP